MADHFVLGIDIGGSGIKGAPVDLDKGDFAVDRLRIPTPTKSTPSNVARCVKQIVEHFADQLDDDVPVGISIPAPSIDGFVPMMANLHKSWEGCNADELFTDVVGRPVHVVNDADAAGIAEVQFGAAAGHNGLVIMTTLGTGIGTALIYRGVLIPNTEFGHLEIDGKDAESQAAASVKDKHHLTYARWSKRLIRYYGVLEKLCNPELFVVGGGVSRSADRFIPRVAAGIRTPIIPAQLQNRAGIIGAAFLAREHPGPDDTTPTPAA